MSKKEFKYSNIYQLEIASAKNNESNYSPFYYSRFEDAIKKAIYILTRNNRKIKYKSISKKDNFARLENEKKIIFIQAKYLIL
jgi:hypothetical protein